MLVQVDTPSPKPSVLLLGHMGRSAVGQVYLPDPRTRPAVDIADISPLGVVGDDHEQPVLPVSRRWCLDPACRTLVRSSWGTGSARKCLIARAEWIVSNNPGSLMVSLRRTRESALPNLPSNTPRPYQAPRGTQST